MDKFVVTVFTCKDQRHINLKFYLFPIGRMKDIGYGGGGIFSMGEISGNQIVQCLADKCLKLFG